MPSIPTADVAAREARRMAAVLREVGGDGQAIGSGWMSCDVPGSWANYGAGLGLDGPVAESTIDQFIEFYRNRGRTPRIQTTPYQHPSLLKLLKLRGFTIHDRVSVLARSLDSIPSFDPVPHIRFRRMDPSNRQDVTDFQTSQTIGFSIPDENIAGMMPILERVAANARTRIYLIELEGRIVGSGGLESFENSAAMFAGCVYSDVRHRGIHSAFIHHRIREAAQAGFDDILIGSTPEDTTERNALRAGFSVAFIQENFRLAD
jgi:hypothetical protein